MKILIVSGFLGAGKTTFIKNLIDHTKVHPVILENEYGDISIDAKELRNSKGNSNLEVLEFMEGCVCCTMKDGFVNSVLTIFSGISPDYLIIEPSGVGHLSSIINNLKPILHDNIILLKPIVIITPGKYRINMNSTGIFKDQVQNANTIIFSKCENESPEVIQETVKDILAINPDVEITDGHYSTQSDSWWNSILDIPINNADVIATENDDNEFLQTTINNVHIHNIAELITLLEDCVRGDFGYIVRAKGVVSIDGENVRFDVADWEYSIIYSDISENQCVFIGKEIDITGLYKRLGIIWNKRDISLTHAYVTRKNTNNHRV